MLPESWPVDPWIVLAALGLEALIGYPARLHAQIPHPVVWVGGLISGLEARWNRPETSEPRRRRLGVATLLMAGGTAAVAGLVLEVLPLPEIVAVAALIVFATLGLAQRSLYDHVVAVARPLDGGDLPAARAAVSMIVGRDVTALDEAGVAAAALESLAESFCDGVVAPAFWLLVGGLPGLFAYKAVNTADSLIGHREDRWRAFGWAAARTDDVMNFIPARIAGALIAGAGRGGWTVMRRDAGKHASPNAGWPEAAMAGALKVRLGGPATYDGEMHERPAFGDGQPPVPADLRRGLKVYVQACGLLWLALLIGGLAWPR